MPKHHAMQGHKRRGGKALRILNFGSGVGEWPVSRSALEKGTCSAHWIGDGDKEKLATLSGNETVRPFLCL